MLVNFAAAAKRPRWRDRKTGTSQAVLHEGASISSTHTRWFYDATDIDFRDFSSVLQKFDNSWPF